MAANPELTDNAREAQVFAVPESIRNHCCAECRYPAIHALTAMQNMTVSGVLIRATRVVLPAACAFLATLAAAADLSLSEAWIRYLPGGAPAGGYFALHSQVSRPVALVGATSPSFGMVMMHRTEEKNGVSRMRSVERVPLPARGKVVFAPGGYHLMLMDPKAPIAPGMKVTVTLEFSNGEKISAPFEVRGAANGR